MNNLFPPKCKTKKIEDEILNSEEQFDDEADWNSKSSPRAFNAMSFHYRSWPGNVFFRRSRKAYGGN